MNLNVYTSTCIVCLFKYAKKKNFATKPKLTVHIAESYSV
jgi:hypothetical protein